MDLALAAESTCAEAANTDMIKNKRAAIFFIKNQFWVR
jgi:hypothetical protein